MRKIRMADLLYLHGATRGSFASAPLSDHIVALLLMPELGLGLSGARDRTRVKLRREGRRTIASEVGSRTGAILPPNTSNQRLPPNGIFNSELDRPFDGATFGRRVGAENCMAERNRTPTRFCPLHTISQRTCDLSRGMNRRKSLGTDAGEWKPDVPLD